MEGISVKKITFLVLLFCAFPALISASQYSFTKFTWSKATFLASGTMCISSLINGLYYQKLSDDAYSDYQNADQESYASSYRVISDNYNRQAAFWKNMSIYSGSFALISAGLDYFIFGQQEKIKMGISYNNDKSSINISMKY